MTRRRFNSGERVALFLADGGVCAQCGVVLGKGWHADHREPWARGGETDVVNGQALCPKCNLEKGAGMSSELRKWQEEAIRQYWDHKEKDFLAEATPGAGKTRFGAEICARLYDGKIVDRIVWVVPSLRLRKQTSDAVREATSRPDGEALQLHYLWKNGDTVFPDGPFAGAVVTYQAVASEPALYRTITSRVPTLVVLDEVHHAADRKSWGAALRSAFEPAVKRLLLSGTPFRSDDHAIPFVRYVEHQGKSDYIYGYADALRDDVVRSVYFPRIGGLMEWADRKGEQTATFEEKLDEIGQSRRLRTALEANGGHLGGMLAQAHRDLMDMREDDDPDAAGLVIAMDQEHALAIAGRMRSELSVEPVVAISDDDDAQAAIDRFAKGRAPWIIAVRMVSEGVDIPRLRIGVYATNVVTELFFRQAVGRVIRRDDQATASFYIPDDARLRVFAAEIQQQRDSVDLADDDEPPKPRNDDEADVVASLFMPLSSTATQEGIIAGDYHLTAEELARAEKVKLAGRETAKLKTVDVALLFRQAGMLAPVAAARPVEPAGDITERIRKLRKRNAKAAARISAVWGTEHKQVNKTLNGLVGISAVKNVTDPEVLERRLMLAIRWFDTGETDEATGA